MVIVGFVGCEIDLSQESTRTISSDYVRARVYLHLLLLVIFELANHDFSNVRK